jgi:hypothetical protein
MASGWGLCKGIQPCDRSQGVLGGQVRVSHSHANGFVTKKLWHGAHIHPGHREEASKRVPQAMPAKIRDLCILEHGLEPTPRLSGSPADTTRDRESFAELQAALTAA